jgi:hypothetical protein
VEVLQGVGIGAALSDFSTLLQFLNSVLTPIITGEAQRIASAKRAEEITKYLNDGRLRNDLIEAAKALSVEGVTLAASTRLQALGQFEEKLAAVRAVQIDISKCAVPKAVAPVAEAADTTGATPPSFVDGGGSPTDPFISCYAAAWQQLNDSVQAAVTAAGQYDSYADLPSDQLGAAVTALNKNFGALGDKKPAVDVNQLVAATTQLIAYAEAVNQALSPANLQALQTDVANLMKDFK